MWVRLVLAVTLALAVGGCGDEDEPQSADPTTSSATDAPADDGGDGDGAHGTVNVQLEQIDRDRA